MRYLLMFLALSLASCGSSNSTADKCAGAYTGTYAGTTQSDSLTAAASCDFTYTGVGAACKSTGTYAAPLGASGTVLVTISSVTGSGTCLPVGQTSCAYSISGSTLTMNCGGGTLSYAKQ